MDAREYMAHTTYLREVEYAALALLDIHDYNEQRP